MAFKKDDKSQSSENLGYRFHMDKGFNENKYDYQKIIGRPFL